jgi:hypothetical protein
MGKFIFYSEIVTVSRKRLEGITIITGYLLDVGKRSEVNR